MRNESSLVIKYTAKFTKQRKSAPFEIKVALREAVALFIEDPDNPQLRNHLLREKYTGFRSIDITGNYRAVFRVKEDKKETVVTFHILGTHEQLYGKI